MRRLAWLRVRIFLKPDDAGLEEPLLSLFQQAVPLQGEEARKAGITLTRTVEEGFEGKKIITLTIRAEKEKAALKLLTHLLSHVQPREHARLERELTRRIDDQGRLYIRLDPEGLLQGRALIIDPGRCVHLTLQLISHPKTREGLLQTARSLLHEVKANAPPA